MEKLICFFDASAEENIARFVLGVLSSVAKKVSYATIQQHLNINQVTLEYPEALYSNPHPAW
jgi:hypothetical protein